MMSGKSHLAASLAALGELRCAAQMPIIETVGALAEYDFPAQADTLCEKIRWRRDGAEPNYADEARRLMGVEVDKFLAAAQKYLSGNEALHALRIEGKQLRYTMEVLAGAFGRNFRQRLYSDLRELQDKLGQINDHAVAQQRFQQWSKRADAGVAEQFDELAANELAQAEALTKDFHRWWTSKRRRHLTNEFRRAVEA
jgi:hypothetical protein